MVRGPGNINYAKKWKKLISTDPQFQSMKLQKTQHHNLAARRNLPHPACHGKGKPENLRAARALRPPQLKRWIKRCNTCGGHLAAPGQPGIAKQHPNPCLNKLHGALCGQLNLLPMHSLLSKFLLLTWVLCLTYPNKPVFGRPAPGGRVEDSLIANI